MADPILGEQQFVPNALTVSHRTRFNRDPVSGVLSVQYSTDGGANWRDFISQPPSVAAEGWIPTLGTNGVNIVWRPVSALIGTAGGTTSTGGLSMAWADFSFPGAIFVGKEFGYFVAPADTTLVCYGAQISAFSQPLGSDIIVGIVNIQNNSSQLTTQNIRLGSGQVTANVFFDQTLTMQPNTQWRLKVLEVGSQSSGEFLSCRLLFRQA